MKKSTLAFMCALLAASWAEPARADTYVNVDCYCDPQTESNKISGLEHFFDDPVYGCVCIKSYTLAKFGTKEFRTRCKDENAKTKWMGVSDQDKPTTCTFVLDNREYITQSCTNWSTLSTDDVHVWVICSQK